MLFYSILFSFLVARRQGASEAVDSRGDPADVSRAGLVDVPVVADVDGDVSVPVEDVPGLGLGDGYLSELALLVLRVVADTDARLAVAVLREAAAVQALSGRRAAPDVWHAELAVRRGDDGAPRLLAGLEVIQAEAVEAVQAVGLHDRLEGLHVAGVRCPPRILQALGHLVRVAVRHRLPDQRVVGVPSCLQEHSAAEPDALRVAFEHDELGGGGVVTAVSRLLPGSPAGLSRHFCGGGVGGGPFHAEQVVVPGGELAHVVSLPALADDLGDRAAGRVPVLLLGVEGGLHHLVGDVGRQSLHGLLVRLVLPESEER